MCVITTGCSGHYDGVSTDSLTPSTHIEYFVSIVAGRRYRHGQKYGTEANLLAGVVGFSLPMMVARFLCRSALKVLLLLLLYLMVTD